MARPGYIEARNRLDKAKADLVDAERKLVDVENLLCIEGLKEIHRNDARKAIEGYRLTLVNAEIAFQSFDRPKIERKVRLHFYTSFPVMMSVSKEMFDAMQTRCETNGINMPELVRRALAPYLGLEDLCPKP